MNGRISRTPRTLVGLVAALGLLVTLSMPAFAAPHEGNPGGNCDTTATSVKTETRDGSIVLPAGTIFCVKAGDTNTGTLVADGETTLNEFLVQEGIDSNVSNFVVYGMATPTPTPTPTPSESEAAATPTPTPSESESEAAATPTPTPTPTPSESESEAAATPTPTPSESESTAATTTPSQSQAAQGTPREDTLGGNPTPGAGVLPNTATDAPTTQVPATLLALLALSSLSVLMYVRLAGAPARR